MTKYYSDGTAVPGTTYGPSLRRRFSDSDTFQVALCIRNARSQLGAECDDKTANEITWELAKFFKSDNPKFEELRFIAACSPSP